MKIKFNIRRTGFWKESQVTYDRERQSGFRIRPVRTTGTESSIYGNGAVIFEAKVLEIAAPRNQYLNKGRLGQAYYGHPRPHLTQEVTCGLI